MAERSDSYFPESEEAKKARVYVKIFTEVELPYIRMLQELATGKTEKRERVADLTYEDVLAYESKIGELSEKIEEIKPEAQKYKDTEKYLNELGLLAVGPLRQAYGARLILTKIQLGISTRPENKEAAIKAVNEEFKKQEKALEEIGIKLQQYKV